MITVDHGPVREKRRGSDVARTPDDLWSAVETLWRYHDLRHAPRRCDVGIGLGSFDHGVAVWATELFHRQMFDWLVFTGATAPASARRFPRGEAVHYREYAVAHGVPADRVLVETRATNTQENLTFTRDLLAANGITVSSVLLISQPSQQRRAYATCRKAWPEVNVVCTSRPLSLADYITEIGDAGLVIDQLVGDTQRIIEYPKRGFAIPQAVPAEVRQAYERLVAAGYTGRLIDATA
jgi:uncharacterized SAM-binding protein YcdF (DUF218 family)